MQNSEGHDYVPTSHYHLSLRQMIVVVLVCAALIALVSAYFLFDASRSRFDAAQSPTDVEDTPVAPVYPENSISFVYPPEYEMRQNDGQRVSVGSLAEYVFESSTYDPQLPVLFAIIMHTADSVTAAELDADEFDEQKASFGQGEDIDGWNISLINDRTFYVQNMETETNTFRRYVTFVGDTRVEFRIEMLSSSQSMQSDELFRQIYIVLNR